VAYLEKQLEERRGSKDSELAKLDAMLERDMNEIAAMTSRLEELLSERIGKHQRRCLLPIWEQEFRILSE
jgi:molybdenum-dependent DNA-binding transcriptional regulator ModE